MRFRAVALGIAILVAGCSSLVEGRPTPTPQDFGGLVETLRTMGITITNPSSGDAGCTDPNLIPTAIAFEAAGPGVTTPIRLRVYIFGSQDAFDRRQTDMEACARNWATDPATFEIVGTPPYVVAGQGPWPAPFKAAIRAGLLAASGRSGTLRTAPGST